MLKGQHFSATPIALNLTINGFTYLQLKRVKRIASANKSGPFVGSEFAYEDLSSFELDKYKFEWEKNEIKNNVIHNIIRAFPQYKYSGYTSLLLSIES